MEKIVTNKSILVFDDTGNNDDFSVTDILYEDEDIIVCNVFNEWYKDKFKVVIYRDNGEVSSKDLRFYYAKNI